MLWMNLCMMIESCFVGFCGVGFGSSELMLICGCVVVIRSRWLVKYWYVVVWEIFVVVVVDLMVIVCLVVSFCCVVVISVFWVCCFCVDCLMFRYEGVLFGGGFCGIEVFMMRISIL